MSSKRFFDHDELTGITSYFHDLPGDGFAIQSVQDVQPFIDLNKAKACNRDYWKAGGDFRHEATIPIGVQHLWLEKYGIEVWNPEHMPDVVKKLNDGEWKYLKCAEIII